MTDFISVKKFKISFAGKTIIKNLSFTVQKGEILGLLGSNGCGKTTTMRALLGIYQPDSGQLLINGQTFNPNGNIKVGYLPEERGLYKKESVLDTMIYFGHLRGLKNPKSWSLKYLKRVGLQDFANTKIEKLSQGMQQKVQLGITIMGDPDVLILDEPTKGFDPVNRRLLMDIIEERHQAGCTIILITHYMEEVERFCDRILLLKDGVAKAYGTIDEVKAKFHHKSLEQIFIDTYAVEPQNDPAEESNHE